MKKVLLVPSWYPSAGNPISGIFIQEQALALANDYDVAVLIPEMARWRNVLRADTEDGRSRSCKSYQEGLPIYREFARPRIPHGPESSAYHTFVRAARSGFQKILKDWGKPDIIHAHVVLPGGWSALNLGKHYSIPVVLTEHSNPFSMHLGTALQRRLVRQTLTDVDRVLPVSPELANQIVSFHPEAKPIVLGNLIRTDFFTPSQNGRREHSVFKFLFVGRLSAEKAVDTLIKAAHVLAKRGVVSFKLIVGGDGPDRANLERLTSGLGIGEKCQFLGSLNREEVRRAINECDVLVLPSLNETFGIVVGEAMACGKPVISTRCGGPEFVITDETGVLVEVANPDALADAMSDFISGRVSFDPAALRASIVNRFGPTAFLQNITRVYEELW
jgi:glycosyltransferase involved in cell wall biosynthesis